MIDYSDKIIYGKDQTQRVVSIEFKSDDIARQSFVELFIHNENNEIERKIIPAKSWMLSSRPLDKRFVRLKGDLHYKYGKLYDTRNDLFRDINVYNKEDVFFIYDPKEAVMVGKGITYFKGLKPQDISILSFDIETNGLNRDENSRVYLISNTFRKNGKVFKKLFSYENYLNDGEMINDWCTWVCSIDPTFLVGHNILPFDLPFLHHVANLYGYKLTLGRDGSNTYFFKNPSYFRKDGSQSISYHKCKIYGREIVDTYFLSIRYDVGREFESYGLKSIIKQLGLEKDNRQHYDASKIKSNINNKEEWEKIKQYALDDSEDALKLYDLMIAPYFYLCQTIPKSFQELLCSATGSQINVTMIRAYFQDGHSLPKASSTTDYEGAISWGKPGIYYNCIKWDVASLYPSIMRQYEIYPKDKDPNRYFLYLVNYFTNERLKNKKLAKETKDKYYDDLQSAQKIFINSCYGFLGTSGLLFNYPKGAAEVTSRGREILTKAIEWATNKKIDDVITKEHIVLNEDIEVS
jgi:DNA polymerase elongation subunit (family B)